MNQKALNALEYPKIIEKLTEKASSYMGKQLCKNLEPSTDLETIRLMQVQTKDALTRLFQKGSISFGNVKDIRGSLKRLEIGSALSIQEILAVCGLLENTPESKLTLVRNVTIFLVTLWTACLMDFLHSHLCPQKSADAFFPRRKSAMMQALLSARSAET